MTVRLYDSAWVRVADSDAPFRVTKDPRNPGVFEAASFRYDIDGRPLPSNPDAPPVIALLSLQDLRQAGYSLNYNGDLRSDVGKSAK